MSESGEYADDVQNLIERIASAVGMEETRVARMLQDVYGIPLAELNDADATALKESWEIGDVDGMIAVISEYDVSDEDLETIEGELREASKQVGNGESADVAESNPDTAAEPPAAENGHTDGQTAETAEVGDGALTEEQRREVAQIVSQATPSADEIASQLQQRAGGQPGGQQGGGQPGSGSDGGDQLGGLVNLMQLMNSGGGGGMSELGEQFHKAALNSYLKRLSRPSLGEIMEMKMYDHVADDMAEEYAEEFFGDPFEELEEPDADGADDKGGGWGPF